MINYIVLSKFYDVRDDFKFEIVNLKISFLDGAVPRSHFYGL